MKGCSTKNCKNKKYCCFYCLLIKIALKLFIRKYSSCYWPSVTVVIDEVMIVYLKCVLIEYDFLRSQGGT